MSTNRVVMIAALLAAGCVCTQAAEFYTPPVVSVALLDKAPEIDGIVGRQEWGQAAVLSEFVTLGGESRVQLPTTVYVGYTEQALYVGARLFDPNPQQLRREVTQRDGEVWRDDCLELFVDTAGERQDYAHLAVNALGTKYDSYDRVVTEDFQWEAAATIHDDGWSVEIQLPFANQIAPQPGDEWIVEVARNAARSDVLSSWGCHNKSFHEPQNFGTLIFGQLPYRVTIDDLGAMWLGDNSAFLSFMPLSPPSTPPTASDVSEWIKLNVRVMGRDKRGHFFNSIKCPVSSPFTEQVMVPYSVKQDGFGTVTFSLTDHEGIVRWRSGPYPVEVPPVSAALAETEQKLGDALVAWAKMAEGSQKQHAQAMLEELLMAWRSLNDRYQKREQMSRAELEDLLLKIQLITRQTEVLTTEISNPGAT
ncbi:MAG: hypothetical protein KAW89_07465 [Armatimonadetes bacterium]|nr:hypothetical protein [Armatimonadota bacterium]